MTKELQSNSRKRRSALVSTIHLYRWAAKWASCGSKPIQLQTRKFSFLPGNMSKISHVSENFAQLPFLVLGQPLCLVTNTNNATLLVAWNRFLAWYLCSLLLCNGFSAFDVTMFGIWCRKHATRHALALFGVHHLCRFWKICGIKNTTT